MLAFKNSNAITKREAVNFEKYLTGSATWTASNKRAKVTYTMPKTAQVLAQRLAGL